DVNHTRADTLEVTSNEAGQIVIKDADDVVLGTGTATANDPVEITLDRPLVDGEEITVEVTDAAGNTGSDTVTADVFAEPPTSVMIGNGDAYITEDEITAGKVDVTIDLPLSAKVGDILIVNGIEKPLIDADILAGSVIVQVDVPTKEGEVLTVEAKTKDQLQNESTTVTTAAELNLMILADDEVQAELGQKGINTLPIASFDSQGLIDLLPGDSTMAKFDFTIEAGSDVVITVEQENLLAVAEAFSFVVKNE